VSRDCRPTMLQKLISTHEQSSRRIRLSILFFAHEKQFPSAQGIAGARPHFQPRQVFHRKLQRAELQIVRGRF